MKRNPKLMILTAGYGDGHLQAARSLQQRFQREGIAQVPVIDLMKEAYPLMNMIVNSLYIKSTKSYQLGLDYYGWSYYMTRDTKPDGAWSKCFNILGKKKLSAIVGQERPHAIINTFPFGAAPEIGQPIGIPTFTIVTDYALHARWIHPDTRKYYVATDELKAELMAKGCAGEQVMVSGIPIRQAFYEAGPHAGTLPEPFDPAKKTVLMSAGSYGVLTHFEKVIGALKDRAECQIIVVCGRNHKLEQRLKLLYGDNPNIRIFGFVERMHELMGASSCIVTKAGGLTLTEALSLQLPIFIYKPFPGQEKENALYLSGKGAASIANTTEELISQLLRFLSEDQVAERMKRSMLPLRKPHATDVIARDVLQTIESEALMPV
jgi:processive 1,2-diacylglycerol beta-glucosyltransferase